MAKTKNKTSKHSLSKKSIMSRTSSRQKENRPNRPKINKMNPDDNIPMSQQLLKKKQLNKKSINNNSRTKRQNQNIKKICGNGKIMPSLADLEKMFEDSSDNDTEENLPISSTIRDSVTTPEPEIPTAINTDILFTPTTRTKIKEQVKEILLEIDDPNVIQDVAEPPMKRQKLDKLYYLNDQQPPANENIITISDYKSDTLSDKHLNNDHQDKKYQQYRIETNVHKSECSSNILVDNGNISDNSSDTVEYNINPYISENYSISKGFCPLPSTSKDNETFIKNDELFNKTLRETCSTNNKTLKVNKPDINETSDITTPIGIKEYAHNNIKSETSTQKHESHINSLIETRVANNALSQQSNNIQNKKNCTETIFIDDDDKNDRNGNYIGTNTKTSNYVEDNDDCILVGIHKGKPIPSEIIDLEYEFLEPAFNIDNNHTESEEIIDVDALIAQNQTIINQYKTPELNKLDYTNLVVDVDVATQSQVTEDSQSNPNMSSNQLPDLIAIEIENPRNEPSHHDIVSTSPTTIDVHKAYGRPIVNRQTLAEYNASFVRPVITDVRTLIQDQVTDFFRHNNKPPAVTNSHSNKPTCTCADLLLNSAPYSLREVAAITSRLSNVNRQCPRHTAQLRPSASSLQSTQETDRTNAHTSMSVPLNNKETPKNNNTVSTSLEKPLGNLGDCPICMDTLAGNEIASTICGHVFCMRCLKQAIIATKRCPTCRKLLKKNGYHKIFL